METYVAFENKKKQKETDPDYFLFQSNTDDEQDKIVGKIYKNRSKKGTDYLKVILFD